MNVGVICVVGAIYVVGWKTNDGVVGVEDAGEVDWVVFVPKLNGVMQTGTVTVTTTVAIRSQSLSSPAQPGTPDELTWWRLLRHGHCRHDAWHNQDPRSSHPRHHRLRT